MKKKTNYYLIFMLTILLLIVLIIASVKSKDKKNVHLDNTNAKEIIEEEKKENKEIGIEIPEEIQEEIKKPETIEEQQKGEESKKETESSTTSKKNRKDNTIAKEKSIEEKKNNAEENFQEEVNQEELIKEENHNNSMPAESTIPIEPSEPSEPTNSIEPSVPNEQTIIYSCPDGYILNDNKCTITIDANQVCPEGTLEGGIPNGCLKFGEGIEVEGETCPSGQVGLLIISIGSPDKYYCYPSYDKVYNCDDGYALSGNKCIKTIDATKQ